eukprot:880849-Pyramimonas_sp.AAC.1
MWRRAVKASEFALYTTRRDGASVRKIVHVSAEIHGCRGWSCGLPNALEAETRTCAMKDSASS